MDWAVTIVGAVAIVLLVKAFVVNPYRIPSSSMEPTLHCARPASGCEARFSDRVLANRFIYHLRDPRRGEIVVFDTPDAARIKCGAGGTFVKRLIGLPGETVEVRLRRGEGYVFINGRQLSEPYIEPDRRPTESFGPVKVPANHYFMMGDNRSQSCDSREWGTVPRGNLIGEVFMTYWPPNRISRALSRSGRSPLGRASRRPEHSPAPPPGAAGSAIIRCRPTGRLPMSTIIESLERRQLRDVPAFKAGDTVRVHFKVIEGTRQRIQVFEGICIKRQGSGVRETFTVRKNSFGVGVERTFPLHSPKIEKLEVAMIGDVNRAKLYYLRGRVGKKSRVRELRQS